MLTGACDEGEAIGLTARLQFPCPGFLFAMTVPLTLMHRQCVRPI